MTLPVLIVLHQEHSTAGRIGNVLRKRGFALDIRRPRFDDPLPQTMAEHAGAIIFGGPQSANDPDDYIRREIDWGSVPLKDTACDLCRPVVRAGRKRADGTQARSRRFRALNPLSPDDVRLLTAVSKPQFGISGLRNQDLRGELYGEDPADPVEHRRRASAVSRKLSLLRAQGLLEKVSKSHRYRVTKKGRLMLVTLLAASNATTKELTALAV